MLPVMNSNLRASTGHRCEGRDKPSCRANAIELEWTDTI